MSKNFIFTVFRQIHQDDFIFKSRRYVLKSISETLKEKISEHKTASYPIDRLKTDLFYVKKNRRIHRDLVQGRTLARIGVYRTIILHFMRIVLITTTTTTITITRLQTAFSSGLRMRCSRRLSSTRDVFSARRLHVFIVFSVSVGGVHPRHFSVRRSVCPSIRLLASYKPDGNHLRRHTRFPGLSADARTSLWRRP